jgi:hypothetical protein
MQKMFGKEELEKQGYSVSIKGFITIVGPKNLTERTSGIITFGRKVDVDSEIGEMIEDRISPEVS